MVGCVPCPLFPVVNLIITPAGPTKPRTNAAGVSETLLKGLHGAETAWLCRLGPARCDLGLQSVYPLCDLENQGLIAKNGVVKPFAGI